MYNYGDIVCAQQPSPHSPTGDLGDLGDIARVNGQNSKGMCQGGKPVTAKLYVCVAAPTTVGAYGGTLSIVISIESSTEQIVLFCLLLGLFVCMWKEKDGIQVLCT